MQVANLIDIGLVLDVFLLPLLLLFDPTDLAPRAAAVGVLLTFLKGAKAMRGDQNMAFLVNMLTEIMHDMKAFMLIQASRI